MCGLTGKEPFGWLTLRAQALKRLRSTESVHIGLDGTRGPAKWKAFSPPVLSVSRVGREGASIAQCQEEENISRVTAAAGRSRPPRRTREVSVHVGRGLVEGGDVLLELLAAGPADVHHVPRLVVVQVDPLRVVRLEADVMEGVLGREEWRRQIVVAAGHEDLEGRVLT